MHFLSNKMMKQKQVYLIDGGICMARKRKIPLRKCIVTKEMKEKAALVRVVRNKAGDVFIDETGKQNGRGAYLTRDLAVIKQAKETRALEEAFKLTIEQDVYEQLQSIVSGHQNDE